MQVFYMQRMTYLATVHLAYAGLIALSLKDRTGKVLCGYAPASPRVNASRRLGLEQKRVAWVGAEGESSISAVS